MFKELFAIMSQCLPMVDQLGGGLTGTSGETDRDNIEKNCFLLAHMRQVVKIMSWAVSVLAEIGSVD